MAHARSTRRVRLHLDVPLILAIGLVMLLWVAGGASREDAVGQVVIRAGCFAILVAAILTGPKPLVNTAKPVLILLLATIALPLIQLIPLPPSWWQALPGRETLIIPGETPPWRPWTMTPGATRNAVFSLVVPVTMLLLLLQANERLIAWLPTILLVMIGSAVLLGLLQFSGARYNSPFLNDPPGQVTSIFANRNHFALLIAIGCLIAPVWAFQDRDALRWRGPLAAGLLLLFELTILATGSRSGMLLGALSLVMALMLIGPRLQRRLKHAPAWMLPVLIGTGLLVLAALVGLSFTSDRANAINRLIELDSAEDLRLRALPTVLKMVSTYMPFGTGFGGFDAVYRIHEPDALLGIQYYNQAHNDFLGIVLSGGVAAIILLVIAILWWLIATFRVWRAKIDNVVVRGRLGSAVIFLVLLASVTDYPGRTPTIMAIVVIAAVWLAQANSGKPQTALPG